MTLRQTVVSWSLLLSDWVSDGRFPECGEDVGCIQMIYPSPCSVFDWGRGEECYHWSVSHPDPPLPLSHHFTCKCVYVSYVVLMSCTSCLCTRVMLVHNGEWREHPRVRCVHTCEAGKAVVSHPQASIALLPWVTLSRYSTSLPCPPPPPPSPPFSSLNQRWLPPFPLSPHQWHHHPPPLTLCCGESHCTLRFFSAPLLRPSSSINLKASLVTGAFLSLRVGGDWHPLQTTCRTYITDFVPSKTTIFSSFFFFLQQTVVLSGLQAS